MLKWCVGIVVKPRFEPLLRSRRGRSSRGYELIRRLAECVIKCGVKCVQEMDVARQPLPEPAPYIQVLSSADSQTALGGMEVPSEETVGRSSHA